MVTKKSSKKGSKKLSVKPAKNMTEMMKNSKSRSNKGTPMLTHRQSRQPCRECAQNKAEDTVMDTLAFGAKAVIGVGVLGALGNTFNNINN